LDSGLIETSARESVEQAIAADRRNFEAGYGVVEEHGLLTPTGRALLDEARHYMSAAGRH
jgi:hypothetical protein